MAIAWARPPRASVRWTSASSPSSHGSSSAPSSGQVASSIRSRPHDGQRWTSPLAPGAYREPRSATAPARSARDRLRRGDAARAARDALRRGAGGARRVDASRGSRDRRPAAREREARARAPPCGAGGTARQALARRDGRERPRERGLGADAGGGLRRAGLRPPFSAARGRQTFRERGTGPEGPVHPTREGFPRPRRARRAWADPAAAVRA